MHEGEKEHTVGRTERRGTEGFVLGCDTSVLQAYPLSYQRVHHWGDSVYPCSANTSGRGRSWRLPWPYLHRRARRIPETVVDRPRRIRRGAGRLADPFRYAVPVCAVLGRLAVMGTAPSGEILSHGHGMVPFSLLLIMAFSVRQTLSLPLAMLFCALLAGGQGILWALARKRAAELAPKPKPEPKPEPAPSPDEPASMKRPTPLSRN